MSVQALVIMAAGLFQGALVWAPPKDEPYYARVQIQGVLEARDRPFQPLHISVTTLKPARKTTKFPLSIRELKGWTAEKLDKCNGSIVRVTGTLEEESIINEKHVKEKRLVIVVRAIEFVEKDDPKDYYPRAR